MMGSSCQLRVVALLLMLSVTSLPAQQIHIRVTDEAPYHVHPEGKSFSVQVLVNTHDRSRVFYHWADFQGMALTAPQEIVDGKETNIRSPGDSVGYYGLVIGAEDPQEYLPNEERGEPHEFGFAILPKRHVRDRQHDPASPFGMVHSDTDDPYICGWVKTATWKNRTPQQMASYVKELRDKGLEELPILLEQEWRTDDKRAITTEELEAFTSRLKSYYEANPDLRYWEFGIEENLKPFYQEAFYWENLAAKAKAAQQVSDETGTDMKIVYQVVASDASEQLLKFLDREAAQHFDIIAIHPYVWKRFPNPDRWLAHGLDEIHAAMADRGLDLPIWFTEVGAPQHSSACGGCLRSAESAYNVSGKNYADQVSFLIRMHAIAFHKGVEKVFWYNYIDRSDDRIDDPEEYFGLRDHGGFPKPCYVAYVTMQDHLDGKKPAGVRELGGNLWAYDFTGEKENCSIVWSFPISERFLGREDLVKASDGKRILKITNPVGQIVRLKQDEKLRVANQPIFITTRADD